MGAKISGLGPRFPRSNTGTLLVGSFVKTPTTHATEILGDLGYDFVLVDEEHGAFGRETIDVLLLATRAAGLAGIVRVADVSTILPALDMGAAGVVVPHVDTPDHASIAAAAARYQGGTRGCSPSPRAGRYGGLALPDHVAIADAAISVTVMIEHPTALLNVDAIAAVDGVDALFMGLGDLAVALGEPGAGPSILRDAAERIRDAAHRHDKGLVATAGSVEAGQWLLDLGISALVLGSDQSLMRSAASTQLAALRSRNSVLGDPL